MTGRATDAREYRRQRNLTTDWHTSAVRGGASLVRPVLGVVKLTAMRGGSAQPPLPGYRARHHAGSAPLAQRIELSVVTPTEAETGAD